MKLFESEEILKSELSTLTLRHRQNLGVVSEDVPLISNLDVLSNIALIKQYHQNLPHETAKKEVVGYLKRYQLDKIANKRNAALTPEQRFRILLLRAAMMMEAVIIIDRPFKLLSEHHDSYFIYDSLNIIDDLYNRCYITDYAWLKDRYGMSDVA